MGDSLSTIASVVELVSLGIQATQSLLKFYSLYKHQDSEIASTTESLKSVSSILQSLENILLNRKFQADKWSLVETIKTSIKNCDKLIQELQDEYQKFTHAISTGVKAVVIAAGCRATYPFWHSTLHKIDKDIGELCANLSFAMNTLQLKDNKRIQDDITDMKLFLDLVKTRQIAANLRDCLDAPDATVNHSAAFAKRHLGTGMWFVKGSTFTAWLTKKNSFLWLNGFAGSGKSVLSSTAIQYAFPHRGSQPKIGIVFFYFAFNENSKQDESGMLQALLVQLSRQLQDVHVDLTRLHDLYKTGIPQSSVLADYLCWLIQRFYHVYIVLDALDESPQLGARGYVLDILDIIQNWSFLGLHLLVTSRNEPDIRSSLNFSSDQEIKMRNVGIDKNITNFILGRLQKDRRLQKWELYSKKIQDKLAERAQSV